MSSSQAQTEPVETHMDIFTLKMHIMKGDKEVLEEEISKLSRDSKLSSLKWKPHNSNILHVAAEAGQLHIISSIVQHDGMLLYRKNDKGDLPIHVALKAGQKDAVWKLVEEEDRVPLPEAVGDGNSQFKIVNNDKNTALHIALKYRFKDLSEMIFDKSPLTFSCLNAQRISPLYLAIQARYFDLVMYKMLQQEFDDEQVQDDLKSGRSVVHEAIMAKNQEVLQTLIRKYDELKYLSNDKGRTLLSYAAEIGFVDGVNYLLNEHSELACKLDEDGSYPIHMACRAGNIHFVKMFFSRVSNTNTSIKFWLNKQGQNILHTAAENGQVGVVKYLLRQRIYTDELINMIDENGDTPLHLATVGKHPKVVETLAADERIDRVIQNKQGLTALDFAEACHDGTSLRERLTWMALLYANVPRSVPVATGFQPKAGEFKYKDRFDILLVVCTLVATVTFSATFTMPGGYNSHQREGLATLAHERAFQVFIFSNTIAMYSSVFSAVTLIWGHLDDIKLSLLSLEFALPSLGIALTMMTIAFMAGLFVVLHTVCEWLAIVILILGGLFLVAFLALFIPLYSPTSHIRNKFVHCIFHFVFRLMLKACS